jgi:hypothetical protein
LRVARAVHLQRGMTDLDEAFHELQDRLIDLDRAWTCEPERSALRWIWRDVVHHVCAALVYLEDVDDALRSPHAAYGVLGDGPRALAREAFLAAVELSSFVRRAAEDRSAPPDALVRAECAVLDLIEQLLPFVHRVDGLLRAMTGAEMCGVT